MKKLAFSAMALATALYLCACGGSAKGDAGYGIQKAMEEPAEAPAAMAYDSMVMEEEAVYEEAYAENGESFGYAAGTAQNNSVTATENAATSNRKLIRRTSLTVETKEFDSCVASIQDRIKELGGYIENLDGYYGSQYASYRSSRNMNIVARIPSDKLDGFVDNVGEISNIVNRSESVEDVTLTYVDMVSHKKMLKEEQNRLMEFLKEAETIEEIISIEDRLTQIKYELDSMESQIRTFDNKVDYATANINIEEVVDYTQPPAPKLTPGERMAEGFVNSLRSIRTGLVEFGIGFVVALPYIVLWAVIIIILFFAVRAILKSKRVAAMRQSAGENRVRLQDKKRKAGVFVNRPEVGNRDTDGDKDDGENK